VKARRHDDFVEHVCELLAPLGEVRAKAMFGGYGIYLDETFCAIVASDTLYFKVDDRNRPDYEALGYAPFKPFDDKPMVMSYYEVPAEVIDNPSSLLEWGRRACEAARRSATRPKRSRLPGRR
jgi:DNA transformation protein